MPILNYTTSKSADTTLAEIQKILVKHGCRKITVDYDDTGQPCNLTFFSSFNGFAAFYSLPCKFDAIYTILQKTVKDNRHNTKEQAIRTGWRILKDWIEAQMAIVEAEIAEMAEVFMPYGVTRNGERLYDYIKSLEANNSPLKLLQ